MTMKKYRVSMIVKKTELWAKVVEAKNKADAYVNVKKDLRTFMPLAGKAEIKIEEVKDK